MFLNLKTSVLSRLCV